MPNDSNLVMHTNCPACGSSDANALYDDGHTHCFSCNATVQPEPGAGGALSGASRGRPKSDHKFLTGDYSAIPSRALDEETCRKFGYATGTMHGKPVQIATYRDPDSGAIVAQKVRGKDKEFSIIGDGRSMPLYGQHLWPATGRRVVITEGEIDALSVAQATGLKWPVVSLPNGAQSAKKALQRALEWLCGYEQVVLCFDADDVGRAAAADCAPLFPPGKCAIASLPRKDANEMLKAGEGAKLSGALWDARTYRPDGIVDLEDIEDRVLSDVAVGRPYPWPSITKATFGRRPGDLIGLGAGTGCGKTDFITQLIVHDVVELGLKCGVLYLEQPVAETGRRLAGKLAGRRFHVPDDGWTQEELKAAWDRLKAGGKLHLYESFGAIDWETIRSKIRYMATSLGCQHCFLDHLTALAAAEEDERKALEKIMAEAAGLAHSLGIVLHFVSHLATPEGRPHEEGGRVQARQFKGSRAVMQWSHFLFGLERDTQDPGAPTTFRVLKDRFTGQSNGWTCGLQYDARTGLLHEADLEAAGAGFTDETDRGDF